MEMEMEEKLSDLEFTLPNWKHLHIVVICTMEQKQGKSFDVAFEETESLSFASLIQFAETLQITIDDFYSM